MIVLLFIDFCIISKPWYEALHSRANVQRKCYPVSLFSFLVKFLLNFFQMTNTIQKKFKVSSTQLLYQSCPYQAMTLFFTGPFLDKLLTKQNVFAFKYTPEVLVLVSSLFSWIIEPAFVLIMFPCLIYSHNCRSLLFCPAWYLSLLILAHSSWLEKHPPSPTRFLAISKPV